MALLQGHQSRRGRDPLPGAALAPLGSVAERAGTREARGRIRDTQLAVSLERLSALMVAPAYRMGGAVEDCLVGLAGGMSSVREPSGS